MRTGRAIFGKPDRRDTSCELRVASCGSLAKLVREARLSTVKGSAGGLVINGFSLFSSSRAGQSCLQAIGEADEETACDFDAEVVQNRNDYPKS